MSGSLHTKVRNGLFWSTIQNWIVRIGSLLLFMWLARLLEPADMGLFAGANVVLGLLLILADQGLSEAVIQRSEISDSQLNTAFWINLITALVLVGLLWIAAPSLAALMKLPKLVDMLRASSVSIPIAALSFGQLAMAKRAFDYQRIAKIAFLASLVAGVIALLLANTGFGVWSLVAQALISSVITTSVLWFRPAWRLSANIDIRATLPLAKYGSSRLLTNIMDFVNTRYIDVTLAATLGPVSLGLYAIGARMHQFMMQLLSASILEIAHNAFSRLSSDREKLVEAYYKSTMLTAAIAVPLFCMVAGSAKPLTLFLFGEKWLPSSEVVRVMAMLGTLQVLQYFNGAVYNAIGRPSINLMLMPLKIALTAIGLYFATDLPLNQMVIVFALSQLPITPLSYYLVRRYIGISMRVLIGKTAPFFVSSLAMLLFIIIIDDRLEIMRINSLIRLTGVCFSGFILYVGLLKIFWPRHLNTVISMLHRYKD